VNTLYLLPCPCGRKLPIQSRQAGEIITCHCGNSIEVPTMLGLKKLEQAELPVMPVTAKSIWTAGHRIIFLGGLVVFAAILIGAWLLWIRPVDPYADFTPDQMQKIAELLTPIQSLRFWQILERGGLEFHKRGVDIAFADLKVQYRVYWWLTGLTAGIGVLLIAGGIIVLSLRKRRTG
jgi:hypothetical protein